MPAAVRCARPALQDADTVARLLVDEKLQQQLDGQVIWIDEAGLLGMKTMSHVFELAEKYDARVALDRRPLSAWLGRTRRRPAAAGRGGGAGPAEVKEIQRQSGAYKAAVKALSEGHGKEGFKRLDELGWVHEVPDDERYRQIAADYVENRRAWQDGARRIADACRRGERITAEIRRTLRQSGKLGEGGRSFQVLDNASLTEAERGDQVNYRTRRCARLSPERSRLYPAGSRSRRAGASCRSTKPPASRCFTPPALSSPLVTWCGSPATASRPTASTGSITALYIRSKTFDAEGDIVLENGWTVGKDWGFLDHGYVVTSHASQGKTVDRVFVGQASESFAASSREQFYVSASRARQQVTVYTDDKHALMEAVSRADERLTATELLNSVTQRQLTEQQERDSRRHREQEESKQQEVVHER